MKSFVTKHTTARRLSHGLGLVLLAVAATGCAPTSRDPDLTGSIAVDGYRTRHPIVVEEGEETLDLPVGANAARLPEALVASVEGFGRSARAAGANRVVVMVPSGSSNEAATRRAFREITAALGRGGIPASALQKRSYLAEGPEDAAPMFSIPAANRRPR